MSIPFRGVLGYDGNTNLKEGFMLCPNCASTISDTAKFCSNCGTSVTPGASPYDAGMDDSASPYADQAATATKAAAQPQTEPEQSPFERGYQQGYAWATGEAIPQAEPVDQGSQGYQQPGQQQGYQQGYQPQNPYGQPVPPVYPATGAAGSTGTKNKIAAGLLGIFLGALGIHKFYLGYSTEGVIMLVATLVGSIITFGLASFAMGIIGIVEGVLYLVKSDEEFYYTYELGHKGWF